MGGRLAIGVVIGFVTAILCLGLYARLPPKLWQAAPAQHLNFTAPPPRHLRNALFAHVEQEHEASRIYHELQDAEYAALEQALDISAWQEPIAVQFDVSNDPTAQFTHRHRLIWDVFSPFYNCPSQQRVGTPPRLFDGGKWICGVQPLLKVPNLQTVNRSASSKFKFTPAMLAC